MDNNETKFGVELQPEASPFLNLPLEIRFRIYCEVLIKPSGWIRIGKPTKSRNNYGLSILRLNHQIHDEAVSVLYGGNRAVLYITRCSERDWENPDRNLLKRDDTTCGIPTCSKGYRSRVAADDDPGRIYPHIIASLTKLRIRFKLGHDFGHTELMTKRLRNVLQAIYKYLDDGDGIYESCLTLDFYRPHPIAEHQALEVDSYVWEECEDQGVLYLLGNLNGRCEVRLMGDLTKAVMEKFEEALTDED